MVVGKETAGYKLLQSKTWGPSSFILQVTKTDGYSHFYVCDDPEGEWKWEEVDKSTLTCWLDEFGGFNGALDSGELSPTTPEEFSKATELDLHSSFKEQVGIELD